MPYIIHFASGRQQRIERGQPAAGPGVTVFIDPAIQGSAPVAIVPHDNVEFIEQEGASAGIITGVGVSQAVSRIIV